MAALKDLYQGADWKREKHVPVIDAPRFVKKDEDCAITISVGKEIPHPNTTEHHIRWIRVYFLPEGEKFPYEIGRGEFTSHGESVHGPDTSTVYTQPKCLMSFKTGKSGTLFASSYCNIHGLWENTASIGVE